MSGATICAALLCLSVSSGASPPDRWFGTDKVKHFLASFVATSISASTARAAGLSPQNSIATGIGIGAGIGVWKEIRDHGRSGETASMRDLVWDLAGVGAAAAVASQTR